MAVAARYSIDNTWYRAKITSLPESRLVNIYYIDYGNSETLPWDQLRVLYEHFIEIPPLVSILRIFFFIQPLNLLACHLLGLGATSYYQLFPIWNTSIMH